MRCACEAGSGLILSKDGCVQDRSDECNNKPMAYYEHNTCVQLMNCPDDMHCNRCEMREHYGPPAHSVPMHCTECAQDYRMIAGKLWRQHVELAKTEA